MATGASKMATSNISHTNIMENVYQRSGNYKQSIYNTRIYTNATAKDFVANNTGRTDTNIVRQLQVMSIKPQQSLYNYKSICIIELKLIFNKQLYG